MGKEKKNKKFGVQGRIVRLRLDEGTLINGLVNIARGPGYDRLSELVGDGDDSFLILFNATVYDKNTKNPEKCETLFVNKTHILWVEPDEEQK